MYTFVGSTAMKFHYPDFRDPQDIDLLSDGKLLYGEHDIAELVRESNPDKKVDLFVDERLGEWKWGYMASPDELLTLKISHAFWEINRSSQNWDKHANDIRFLQRNGAKFIRELYDILLPIWKERYGKNRVNLNKSAGFMGTERWKEYPGDSRYKVSNFGRVQGIRGEATYGNDSGDGLYKQRAVAGKTVLVHKMVAETWIGPRPEGMQICHGDGNGHNNKVTNLRYDSPKGNNDDKYKHKTVVVGEKHPLSKLTLEDAKKVHSMYDTGEWTQRGIADFFGVAQSLIGRVINGQSWPEAKSGFFDDAVKRKYVHDSIHESVAYTPGHALYKNILKEGSDVLVDNDKFWALPLDVQLRTVREEIYATALERILIPKDYKTSPRGAYWWALRRTATSLFKGEWALFLMLHLDELAVPDMNYMQQHLNNMDQLIPLENNG